MATKQANQSLARWKKTKNQTIRNIPKMLALCYWYYRYSKLCLTRVRGAKIVSSDPVNRVDDPLAAFHVFLARAALERALDSL